MSKRKEEQPSPTEGARYGFEEICALEDEQLEELVSNGVMPDMASIAGWEFRGRNISPASKVLNLRRFIKGFCAIPHSAETPDELDGYNLWVHQDSGLKSPWRPIMKDGKPWRHGFYKVYPVKPDEKDNKHPNALLINYSRAENPFYHPGTLLKDYFVQVYADNPDLYLGKVYVALGEYRIFGGYFVMERMRERD